jgi:hypothetical protein
MSNDRNSAMKFCEGIAAWLRFLSAYHAGGHGVESLSSGTVSQLSSQRRVAAVLTLAKTIELAWLCHWQRFEQDRVNKREDRCARSNAEGEGQNGNERKPGVCAGQSI